MTAGFIHEALAAAGLPVERVVIANANDPPTVTYTRALTPSEQTTANGVLATIPVEPRVPRNLRAIVADLDALSGANKLAIWNHINGGSPPRWTHSNQGEVWVCLRMSELVTDPLRTNMRLTAVALYVRNENPYYLVNPSFAPTVNVPGDTSA